MNFLHDLYSLSRANARTLAATVLPAFILMPLFGAPLQHACKPLREPERTRLADYVSKKYNLPQDQRLIMTSDSFVGETCFRRAEFKGSESTRSFKVQLFLSPDLRFLTTELLDSSVDPVLEKRKKDETFARALDNGHFPSRGPKDANVIMTIFSDFQCPYCSQLARMLNKDILPTEGKRARIVFRYFPLTMHKWARPAAEAAACVQEQGDEYFWSLHDFLFEQQHQFNTDNVLAKITEETKSFSKFDSGRFSACLASKKTASEVDRDIAFGTANGVNGTPTVFINGERIAGVVAPEQIRTLIREASAQSKTQLRATVQ